MRAISNACEISCAKCGHAMSGFDIDARHSVGLCPQCKGMWLKRGVLASSTGVERDFPDLRFIQSSSTPTTQACPDCPEGVRLYRAPFAPDSRIEIDTCRKCEGVFLDAKELPFVQTRLRAARRPRAPGIGRALLPRGENGRNAAPAIVAILWVAVAYARYYRFVTLGSSEGVAITAASLAQGLLYFGLPFALLAAWYGAWKFRHSALVSGSLWFGVWVFHATFGWKEFVARHPDSWQCVATLVSVYLGMGVMLVAGHGLGSVSRGLLRAFLPQASK